MQYTNLKFPTHDRKQRTHKVLTTENEIGTIAWRQDEDGPVECILVMLDGIRTFVTVEKYRSAGNVKFIDGKPFTLLACRQEPKKRRLRSERYLRGYAW